MHLLRVTCKYDLRYAPVESLCDTVRVSPHVFLQCCQLLVTFSLVSQANSGNFGCKKQSNSLTASCKTAHRTMMSEKIQPLSNNMLFYSQCIQMSINAMYKISIVHEGNKRQAKLAALKLFSTTTSDLKLFLPTHHHSHKAIARDLNAPADKSGPSPFSICA